MNVLLSALVSLALAASTVHAENKYGFTAESDAALLERVRDPEIEGVVLGCVYKYQVPKERGKEHTSHVTVIESYKGNFTVGQKIAVVVYAEGGPTEEQELGTLRFYLLLKRDPADKTLPESSFECEWTDTLSYSRYGEALRQLLRTQKK
ncbi:MAG TPA: hypothetical protein VLE43_14830 [Candidatus Saccharimonadia bacterium]|nr:hypothetical protein [Candidatus Saccharimonadia bacterium]